MRGTVPSGLLELALTHVTDAVILTDSSNRVVYSNPLAQSLAGQTEHRLTGAPVHVAFKALGDMFVAATERIVRDPPAGRDATSFMLDPSPEIAGPLANFECSIHVMGQGGGPFAGAAILLRDLSQQRAAEFALRSSEQILQANVEALFDERERAQVTLHSIGDAVICADFRGRVTYLNRRAEAMIGLSHGACVDFPIDDIVRLIDASTRQNLSCPTAAAIIEDRIVAVGPPCVLRGHGGAEIAAEVTASPIHDKQGGVVGAVLVVRDVTIARELSGRLAKLALHDSLTELPNRALFAERLEEAIGHSLAVGSCVGLLYLDLDRFKQVNDTLGHAVGDALLKAVSLRLQSCVKSTDTVCRQGGDEFVVALFDVSRRQDIAACALRMLRELSEPCRIDQHQLSITASIGIAVFPDDATDGETLLRYADAALYQAKSHGRNTHRFFEPAAAGHR